MTVRANAKQASFWIVSCYPYYEHATVESAEAAQTHLAAQFPEKKFRIFRCKRRLSAVHARSLIDELARALRAARDWLEVSEEDDCHSMEALHIVLSQADAALAKVSSP